MDEHAKAKVLDFLNAHPLCVVSTIHTDGSGPESAVVAFSQTNDLEIVFGTSNTTRKYKNLQQNKNVSFVIGWSDTEGTIQYEGTVTEMSLEEARPFIAKQVEKIPSSKGFVDREDQRWFIVKPKWIRFLDHSVKPHQVFEHTF